MPPRVATIAKKIDRAIAQISLGKAEPTKGCLGAQKTLQSLSDDLGAMANRKKKAPTAFAKFVKEQYKQIQAKNPGLKTTQIMPKIAEAWHIKNGTTAATASKKKVKVAAEKKIGKAAAAA